MSYFIPLTDESPNPVEGEHHGKPMGKVPDRTLSWYYSKPWLKRKYPAVYDYIVRNANAISDVILRPEDRK
jgi:hypothetical protein